MKKLLLTVLAAFFFLPSSLWAGLQEDALAHNLVARFQGIIAQRGGDPDSIARDNMVLEKVIPFTVDLSGKSITMYAVRISLVLPEEGHRQQLNLVVDETGTIQLDGALVDLKSGMSVHQDALDELARIEQDPGVGDLLFSGTGRAEVLFLSDPLCPYCRHAYTYMLDQEHLISSFSIAHYPLGPGSGAVALVFLMMEHKGEDNFQEVVDFAYMIDRSKLSGNADHAVIRIFNEQFHAFTASPAQVLEDLRQRHQQALDRDMEIMRDMGLGGTPVTFINGIRVDGFGKDRIHDLLNRAND